MTWINIDDWYHCKTKYLDIRVHKNIGYSTSIWLLTCNNIGLRKTILFETDIERAKEEAMKIIRNRLNEIIQEVTE